MPRQSILVLSAIAALNASFLVPAQAGHPFAAMPHAPAVASGVSHFGARPAPVVSAVPHVFSGVPHSGPVSPTVAHLGTTPVPSTVAHLSTVPHVSPAFGPGFKSPAPAPNNTNPNGTVGLCFGTCPAGVGVTPSNPTPPKGTPVSNPGVSNPTGTPPKGTPVANPGVSNPTGTPPKGTPVANPGAPNPTVIPKPNSGSNPNNPPPSKGGNPGGNIVQGLTQFAGMLGQMGQAGSNGDPGAGPAPAPSPNFQPAVGYGRPTYSSQPAVSNVPALQAIGLGWNANGAWVVRLGATLDIARNAALTVCNSQFGGCSVSDAAVPPTMVGCLVIAQSGSNAAFLSAGTASDLDSARTAAAAGLSNAGQQGDIVYAGCNG